MNPMLFSIGIGVSFTVIFLSVFYRLFIVKADEKGGGWTIKLKSGEIAFVVKGGTPIKVLANVPGWHYDEGTERIVEDSTTPGYKKPIGGVLEELFGIYWVSWLYPLRRVHVYRFEWEDRKRDSDMKDFTQIEHRNEMVDTIFWQATYPITAEKVELQGQINIDIKFNVTLQCVNPRASIFTHKGKWLAPVIAAIQGAAADYAKTKNLDGFTAVDKASNDSDFTKAIKNVNTSASGAKDSVTEIFGTTIVKVDYVDFKVTGGQGADVEKATTELELAKIAAEALKVKALGDAAQVTTMAEANAKATITTGTAEAERLKMIAATYTGPGGRESAEVKKLTELGGGKLTTLIIGQGAGLNLNLPSGNPPSVIRP